MPSFTSPRPSNEAQAAELRKRLRGLAPAHVVLMRKLMRLHAAGDRRGFEFELMQLQKLAPEHPEVQFWLGVLHTENGAWPEAAAALQRVAAHRRDELQLWTMLGSAQGNANDVAGAEQSFRRAADCEGAAGDWIKLSIECDRQGFYEEALKAADSALRSDRNSAIALLQRSRCHKALGHAEAAAADSRALIAMGRETARAWFTLVDLKTVPLSESELGQLDAASKQPGLAVDDRQLLDFAFGQALESAGEYERALAALHRANASVRAAQPWNGEVFAGRIESIRAAFNPPAVATATPQGREVIFLVGLPRSGSTLVEQVLAAHPEVEGASELPYLGQVIEAESRRRGQPFPAWVSQASADDWTRLGQHYLRLSARWRQRTPIATDKLPDNWLYVGAVRAMLPQARIIDCRRDPLETCWSCYKQRFAPGLATYSYGFDSLAQYARACELTGDLWARTHPGHVRVQSYESLVAEPEPQIRELLAFCELPFDEACLDFQNSPRAIRTPSALQVRQPLRQTSTPAHRYGPLLEPLRAALRQAQQASSNLVEETP